ncbi:hypothetical protein [Motilibacter aurantiacus]|nr:hypothetical protein [Motilibacter aurantiacus]
MCAEYQRSNPVPLDAVGRNQGAVEQEVLVAGIESVLDDVASSGA